MVQLALAWVIHHGDVTCTLIGARTTQHIDNAIQASKLTLDPSLRAELRP